MVEADARDDGEHRPRYVCGIEPATQSRFKHCQVDACLGKVDERDRRHHLEPRRTAAAPSAGCSVHRINGRHHHIKCPHEIGRRDGSATHANAFFDGINVRRHVAAHSLAGGLENGGQHGDGRALALGARNVDDRKSGVRVAHGRQQPPHPRQAKGARQHSGRHGPLEVEPAVEPGQRRRTRATAFA